MQIRAKRCFTSISAKEQLPIIFAKETLNSEILYKYFFQLHYSLSSSSKCHCDKPFETREKPLVLVVIIFRLHKTFIEICLPYKEPL